MTLPDPTFTSQPMVSRLNAAMHQGAARKVAVMAVYLSMAGCANVQEEPGIKADYWTEEHVLIQACLPARKVFFETITVDAVECPPYATCTQEQLQKAPKTVLRMADSPDPQAIHRGFLGYGEVTRSDGGFSDSADHIWLIGRTAKNQPVYEHPAWTRPRDYVAVHLYAAASESPQTPYIEYWFKLPKQLYTDRFTEWLPPVSSENERAADAQHATWWKLTHGRDMDMNPTPANAPRIRFKIWRDEDRHVPLEQMSAPALAAARRQYGKATDMYRLIGMQYVPIPDCD
ncbi:MAG: hypothetical protein QM749_06190 [Aquabacterium sp.]